MIYNPFSLEGKKILVTGASSGIGRAIAVECSKMGASVIITGRNPERLDATKSTLAGSARLHRVLPCDLQNADAISDMCSRIDYVDGIVNCAGIVRVLPFKFLTSNGMDEVMTANFKGGVLVVLGLLKSKKIRKRSSIVFVSSINGNLVTSAGHSIYCASKAAINGIAKGMALELAAQRTRVNTIMPGIVQTNLLSGLPWDEVQMDADQKKYPLGYGEPEDVAMATIFLLSDASKWVTGSNLTIDGGYTLQ